MKIKGIKIAGIELSLSHSYILLFVLLISLIRFHFDPVYLISWDVFGYYLYLPATFIHHDPLIANPGWVQAALEQYQASPTLYQLKTTTDGALVDLYTMGMAIAWLPAFFVGHTLAYLLNFPMDGFSIPYQYALAIEGLFALLISLLLLRKLLLRYFSEFVTVSVLVTLSLGTNFLEMAYGYFHSPHGFLFLGYTLVLWLTFKWHEHPKPQYEILLGLLIGWMTLTRPVEVVSLAILFFWGIGSKYTLIGKIRFFFSQKISLLLFFLFAVLVVLPQLFYYKVLTGHWIYNTYFSGSEGMDLGSPHTWQFLFSFRKGWLIYTPVMVFAIIGLILSYRKQKGLFWPFLVFLACFIYLYSSWSIWWYAFCFSQRVMVQAYPILAILLGFFFSTIGNYSRRTRIPVQALVVFFIFLNLFQTWQYSFAKILDGSRMTKAYYCRIFGKAEVSDEDRKLLLIDRANTDKEVFTDSLSYLSTCLVNCDFETDLPGVPTRSTAQAHGGTFSLKMDSTMIYSMPYRFCFKDLTTKDHAWLRISFYVYPVDSVKKDPFSLVVLTEHRKDLAPYKYRTANIENPEYKVVKGQWNQIVFDYMTPEVRSVGDSIRMFFWHRGKMPVYVDDFKIISYRPKD
ncbi:MAG: hypothetical protein WCO63_05280 [Bacteroidota bacterium]